MLAQLTDWLSHEIANHGYLVVFGFSFIENSAMAGLILPGDTILVLSGFYANGTNLSPPLLILCGIAGAVLGDNLAYALGRSSGRPLLERLSKRYAFFGRRLAGAQGYFDKHGATTVVTGRFVAFVRAFVPFLAGVGKMRYRDFFIYNLVGATVQITGLLLLGFFFGAQWPLFEKILGRAGLVLLVIAAIGGVLLYRRRRRRA
jgi:undecaprenyl-diphosphatase